MLTYATFVTGLQAPISQWSTEEGYRIRQVLDGAILYDAPKNVSRNTSKNPSQNKKALPCFFNTFSVLDFEKRSGLSAVESLMRKVLQRQFSNIPGTKKSRGSFRIVTSRENQLIAVDKRLRSDVERLIAYKTGLVPDRRGGGREFWFLARSEGIVLFMERQPSPKEHPLKKGELRPQLAYCLNRLAEPTLEDIMLDPFCGYGAITKARAAYFPCQNIYGMDNDAHKIKALQSLRASGVKDLKINHLKIRNTNADSMKMNHKEVQSAVKYQQGDIRRLSSISPIGDSASIDVIVTDPPWGLYGNDGHNAEADIPALYTAAAAECIRVIKPGGRIVILTAQKELMRMHINNGLWGNKECSQPLQHAQPPQNIHFPSRSLQLDACYDILVSGQKAAIFVIKASAN